MKQVLIVEDSKTQQMLIKKRLMAKLGIEAVFAASMAEAKEEIKKNRFFVALLDLNLPDSPNGEIIDYVLEQGIPVIVLTASYERELRERISAKPIMDYILKSGVEAIDYATYMVKRANNNPGIRILLVDDSKTLRLHLKKVLQTQRFDVLEASDGKEALEVLNKNPDIRMVITDYNMPEINGIELTKKIREKWSKEELCIIAISADEANESAIQFLKFGANDYIVKPFTKELLTNRINHNVDMLEMMQEIRHLSEVDYLTKLYNRRFFFQKASKTMQERNSNGKPFSIAMMDIDHFKSINDKYGHASGDEVLKAVALVLKRSFDHIGIVARFGGEEFCVLLEQDDEISRIVLERFRNEVEGMKVVGERGVRITFTISVGLNTKPSGSLDDAVNGADKLLYEAKHSGRNRVVSSS